MKKQLFIIPALFTSIIFTQSTCSLDEITEDVNLSGIVIDKNTRKPTPNIEIGIRKVNGAKIFQIMRLLNIDFVKWVVIAFIIAVPVAYYTMNKWLNNFAYKTNLDW